MPGSAATHSRSGQLNGVRTCAQSIHFCIRFGNPGCHADQAVTASCLSEQQIGCGAACTMTGLLCYIF